MKILIIDDEAELRSAVAEVLRDAGHDVVEAGDDGRAAQALIDGGDFDLAISDVRMPSIDGLALFRRARTTAPSSDFILMTAFGEVGQAVAALKEGAADYLTKPFDIDELLHQITRIESARSMRSELAQARQALAQRPPRNRLVGESPQMLKLQTRIEMIAQSEAAVLVHGESGTGKELVARLLHDRGPRAAKPFVAVNCGAFPETLIEAELFGFERGAFTGAMKKRDGRFKAADRGTLFLDEIAELPLPAQAKLLRVLEEGVFEPIGTNVSVKVDVRLVSATHRDLRQRIADGLFREDLFYRVNVLDVPLPALREREGDLPILIQFFLDGFGSNDASGERRVPRLSADAFAALTNYSYPGNVRELAHAIEHAVVLAGGGELTLDHLPAAIAEAAAAAHPTPVAELPISDTVAPPTTLRLADAVRAFEKAHLRRVLAAAGGKRVRAAEMLGISRKTLWERLRDYDVEEAQGRHTGSSGSGSASGTAPG
jgi:two-component system, NtrC family, response regulator AtoC